jgi:hypothetical protein
MLLEKIFALDGSVVDPGPHPHPDPHHFGTGNLDPHPHQIKIRIRILIKVISWIRNRIQLRIILQMMSQNVWNMSLFEPFCKGLSLYWKLGSGS